MLAINPRIGNVGHTCVGIVPFCQRTNNVCVLAWCCVQMSPTKERLWSDGMSLHTRTQSPVAIVPYRRTYSYDPNMTESMQSRRLAHSSKCGYGMPTMTDNLQLQTMRSLSKGLLCSFFPLQKTLWTKRLVYNINSTRVSRSVTDCQRLLLDFGEEYCKISLEFAGRIFPCVLCIPCNVVQWVKKQMVCSQTFPHVAVHPKRLISAIAPLVWYC